MGLGIPAPAYATGMMSVLGNIHCQQAFLGNVGGEATARGTVDFQLNYWNNTGQLIYVSLGYSSAYAPWGWKFWTSQAGNFYAYGFGTNGNVIAISRFCMSPWA